MAVESEAAAVAMAERASEFLAALTDSQRQRATLSLGDEAELSRWYYTPTRRAGLPLNAMNPRQQRLAHRLLASGLSAAGYATAATIIGLDNILDAKEGWRTREYPGEEDHSSFRDPGAYYFAIFGDPASGTWAWRAGGHHVSVHRTIVGGRLLVSTPTFFGADPAESELMAGRALRPLAAEEDLGRELLRSLAPEQMAAAIISSRAPFDIVQSNRPRVEDGALPFGLADIFSVERSAAMRTAGERMQAEVEREFLPGDFAAHRYDVRQPKGLAAAKLTASQHDCFRQLLLAYVQRLDDATAELEWTRIEPTLRQLYFAWAGGTERRQPHYYRVQGPRFLIEYDNVQNGANHIHAVWRDPDGDFGRDILSEHHASAHSAARA